jgi:hypothetical protein
LIVAVRIDGGAKRGGELTRAALGVRLRGRFQQALLFVRFEPQGRPTPRPCGRSDAGWLTTGGSEGFVLLYELTPNAPARPIEVFRHPSWVFDRASRFLFSHSEDGQFHRAGPWM